MKKKIRIAFYVITVAIACIYAITCFTPYISPAGFWPMGLLALGFPILFCVLICCIVVWFFMHKRIALALIVCALIGYKNIGVLFAWHFTQSFTNEKSAGSIRIMGWNVNGFSTQNVRYDSAGSARHRMLQYIKKFSPDILCLQDFIECKHKLLPSNIQYLKDSLHYSYYYFADDYKLYPSWGPAYTGIAVFSRFPLNNVRRIFYSGKQTPESIITADINIYNVTRRVIVTHLQSMHLGQRGIKYKEPWEYSEDSAIIYSGSMFNKLRFFIPYHAVQADLLRSEIDKSPYPVILSLDMNEVPSSYCYHTIKGAMKDVFLQKGFGLGRTYHTISPTLRIDYLMTSQNVEVVQYKKDNIFLSDHYPQVMDIRWVTQ